VVSALYECVYCGLRFRVPKDSLLNNREFYQEDYWEGISANVPSDDELRALLTKGFEGHEKDYKEYIAALKASGLIAGSNILDFGAAWGYGSHQLREAGFNVVAYEISLPRARFAAEKLRITTIADPSHPPEPVDCFFSAHVMEHLPDPNVIWQIARSALKPKGLFVAFVPNGEPLVEHLHGSNRYHKSWGQLHPLFLTSKHLKYMASKYGFEANLYSAPYPLGDITNQKNGDLGGIELCIIARRSS
jgi:2-polyprenyl-3-methyl-5-hydroxy-6-metoxy-1,4-benzoquinol methylase